MKKSRFTDSQILSILKQNEGGAKVANLYREHGMSEANHRVGWKALGFALRQRPRIYQSESDRLGKSKADHVAVYPAR